MKYKVHKTLETKNPKRKAALDERIKKELDIPDGIENIGTESYKKKPFYKTFRFIAGVSTALLATCLAIVLPIMQGNNVQITEERYCNANECNEIPIEYSIKEYGERNNLSYLYIDWYTIADEVQTKLFVNADKPDDLIYVQEMIANGETGSFAVLSITDLYTRVDVLEALGESCDDEVIINGISIHWHSNNRVSEGYFEYGKYRYFIELTYPLSDDYILELIESMMP